MRRRTVHPRALPSRQVPISRPKVLLAKRHCCHLPPPPPLAAGAHQPVITARCLLTGAACTFSPPQVPIKLHNSALAQALIADLEPAQAANEVGAVLMYRS